jgi:hypothetical protein
MAAPSWEMTGDYFETCTCDYVCPCIPSIDNTLHPANPRLALAKSTGSHVHAFGLDWDDTSGRNNGHFAPFSWRG